MMIIFREYGEEEEKGREWEVIEEKESIGKRIIGKRREEKRREG